MFYHPGMARWGSTFAAVGLVLVAAAPAVSAMAGGPSLGKKVPGLGQYAGGEWCITQTPPWKTTTTPDTVTYWTELNGTTIQNGPYNLHDGADNANMRSGISRAVKIQECWED